MPDHTHTEHAITNAGSGDDLHLFAYDVTVHVETRTERDGEIVLEGRSIDGETEYRLRSAQDKTRLVAETRDAHDTDSEYSRKGITRGNIDGVVF